MSKVIQATRMPLFLALVASLSACDVLPFGSDGNAETNETGGALTPVGDLANARDVEAPNVFNLSEQGLWDGRPSLGGVWVAHPSVTDPERVIIRNTENNQSVIGALFRRERENPGPALQVSSDAAQELGMLAGDPANLSVIALRREAKPATETAITDFDTPEVITAQPLDDIPGTDDTDMQVSETPAAAPAPVATSSLAKPFVQIGIFSMQENADNTATALRGDGLAATVLEQESQGKSFYRVIVGPAPTEQDRAAVLAKVRDLGFSDAYPVTN